MDDGHAQIIGRTTEQIVRVCMVFVDAMQEATLLSKNLILY